MTPNLAWVCRLIVVIHWKFLLAAGLLSGALNAMAGGGSFVSLPALVSVGVPSVAANATSTVALYPGGVASAWVYRDRLFCVCGIPLRQMLIVTGLGGLAGALLLLWTPTTVFDKVLPWLLLTATIAMAFGARLGPMLRARFRMGVASVLVIQFLLGVYGGYFGGAVGLMMVSLWLLIDGADISVLHAPRTLLVTAANTVAVVCFIVAGVVSWPQALVLSSGALAGGFGGAWAGRILPKRMVRIFTVALTALVTVHFFMRGYGGTL